MNDELPRIQEQVYYGHIQSRTDVLDKFLSENGISRYNPQVKHFGYITFWGYFSNNVVLLIVKYVLLMRWCRSLLMANRSSYLWLHLFLEENPCWMTLIICILLKVSFIQVETISFMLTIFLSHCNPDTWFLCLAVDDLKPVTHLLSVDAASKKGMKLLHEGLRYLVILNDLDGNLSYVFFILYLPLLWLSSPLLLTHHHHHHHYWCICILCPMMQIEGSKRARVGVLFSVNSDAHLSGLLFVKVFEITASSFRFV